jgi:hypothetical protein
VFNPRPAAATRQGERFNLVWQHRGDEMVSVELYRVDDGDWSDGELVDCASPQAPLVVRIAPRFPSDRAARLLRDLADRLEIRAAEIANHRAAELRRIMDQHGLPAPQEPAAFLRDLKDLL